MKKSLLLIIVLFISVVLCENVDAKRQRSGGLRVTPRNTDELKSAIETRKENSEKQIVGMEETRARVHRHQNMMRNAAQNIMIMENMIGDDGYEASELASFLNESSEKTVKHEEEFVSRNRIKKFFFGQKKASREEFTKNMEERGEKIERLRLIYEGFNGDSEVKSIFESQLLDIEEEQERLEQYASREVKRKGVLGWVLDIFR